MIQILLFGIGSPVIVDVEESLSRCGVAISAGVCNRPGARFLSEDVPVCTPKEIDATKRALPFLVPLFTPGHRQIALREGQSLGLTNPFTLIDPSVVLPRRIGIGPGTYINAGCSLGSASELGSFTFVNCGVSLGHHAQVSDFVSIGPGVVVAGQVSIGRGAVLGAGATVLPEVRIGENAVVGAGAVVSRDVAPDTLVMGNPARLVRSGIGGHHGLAVE